MRQGSCNIVLIKYCPGTNGTCPIDTALPNGTPCNTTAGPNAQCASGVCTSRDIQCTGSGVVVTTGACPAYAFSCALNCQNSAGQCYALNGNFLDGTPCAGVGRCKKGSCDGTNICSMF